MKGKIDDQWNIDQKHIKRKLIFSGIDLPDPEESENDFKKFKIDQTL